MNNIDACANIYDLSYTATDTDAIVALACDTELDGVTYITPHKFLAENYLQLRRGPEAHLEYNVVTFPQEVILRATLYANFILPKDPVLREEYINTDDQRVWDWMYNPEFVTDNFVPVKTIDYPTGWFSFGTIALPIDLTLYLDIEFEVFKNDYTPRIVLVKSLILSNEHRGKMWNENTTVKQTSVQNLVKLFNKM